MGRRQIVALRWTKSQDIRGNMKLKFPIEPGARIMAIDPGGTCGFATCGPDMSDNKAFQKKFALHDQFLQELNEFYPDILVMEKFLVTHRDKADYTAIEYIGLGRWFAERRRIPFILQSPSMGKGYFTNDKLKRLNVYLPGRPHAMDAMRHLYQFMVRNELFDLTLLKE